MWEKIEKISGINKENILNTIGFEPKSLLPVLITVFFMYKKEFKNKLPYYYERFCVVFNINE